ncbi:MAG: GH1 family beta-glucosidase [Planctomycetota bacterium]
MQTLSSRLLWGAATAAYQVEGAADDDGRGPSIWDVFSRTPGKTANGDTGDVACDHYHRWREDLALMRELNLQAYRFSVSWSRVLPQGRGPVNAAGLDFYDRLVDGLCAAGIVPFVTLYHWDLPAALQMELNGWLHPDLPKLFADYAGLMFDRLGDRVPFWLTLNEPWCVVDGGYFSGGHAPGARNREWGYLAGHNLLRAHAYAVARYRSAPQPGGAISFALNMACSYPASSTEADRAAAERAMVGMGGWFGDPTYYGDYPAVMRARLGPLLPEFTPEDSTLLKRSTDYLALNYYLSEVVRDAPGLGSLDHEEVHHSDHARTAMNWPIVPDGLRGLLHWLGERYPNLPLYITENGACFDDHPDENEFVEDAHRIAYLRDHIAAVQTAVAEGLDVRGYFVWSLLDNFEWAMGYSKRLGLVRCDYATQRRTVKASGRWYARWIATGELDSPIRPAATNVGKPRTGRASVRRV